MRETLLEQMNQYQYLGRAKKLYIIQLGVTSSSNFWKDSS